MFFRTILLSMCAGTSAFGFPMLGERDLALMLSSSNYDPAELDSVVAAAHDASYVTRMLACELLAYRPGQKSVETLKSALRDLELQVRISAARALLILGNRATAVAQLLKDWEVFFPAGTERETARMAQFDPYQLTLILDLGLVLTESGDGRALPLGEFAAQKGTLAVSRSVAVDILCAGLALDKTVSGKWGVDPGAVLQRVSATEQQNTVLSRIRARLEKMPGKVAVPILNELVRSPHLLGVSKQAVQSVLKRKEAEARGEAPASQPAHGVQTPVGNHPRTQPQPG